MPVSVDRARLASRPPSRCRSRSTSIVEPLSVPSAVPATFRSPAHVALNDPLAVVAVCSVTFHLKSVQVDGDGMTLAEAHVAHQRARRPLDEGPSACSCARNPRQPAAAAAIAQTSSQQRGSSSWSTRSEIVKSTQDRGSASLFYRPEAAERQQGTQRPSYHAVRASGARRGSCRVAVEVVAQRLGRAAERELVPRDLIGVEQPRLEALVVAAQLAADAVAA